MKINHDPQKREQANSSKPNEGPLSKENFNRFNNNMRSSKDKLGIRRAIKYDEKGLITEVIQEEDQSESETFSVAEVDNPLISSEYVKIIEAAIPKYTMQQLLGLSDNMYLTLKNTEYWMHHRGHA